jgi:hypothetical protein
MSEPGYVDKHFVLHNPENPFIRVIGVQTIDKVSLRQGGAMPSGLFLYSQAAVD